MNEDFSYRNLRVYKQAKSLVVYVYNLLRFLPKEEQYALCDQLRRAAVSIPSNIAEGMGRSSIKEQIHFIEIAFGSLNEVMCQLELAMELKFITEEQLIPMRYFPVADQFCTAFMGLKDLIVNKVTDDKGEN